ncbi:hypothetical protein [Desulfonatronum parangueonense]
MTTISLRGIDADTKQMLKAEAERTGASINSLILEYIRKGLGIGQDQGAPHDDLDHLAGTWTETDENSFREATEPFGQIDEGMWR